MLRVIALFLSISGPVMCVLAASAHADRFTTRIETRPYYGAVVTLEHGVRVYRPLPLDTAVSASFAQNALAEERGEYAANLYTSDGHHSAPASGRAYQWRPGFYRVLARGDEVSARQQHHNHNDRPRNNGSHAISPAP